jgi:CTP:molybdopterin cytidylyltransferase MocA
VSGGPVVGAVLAAGAGRRFAAAPKQLAPFAGRPLIERPLAALAAARSVDRTLVVLGCEAEAIRRGADLSPAAVVLAPDWERGQSAALRAAVAAAGADAATLVVVLGDQPLLDPRAVDAVVAAAAQGPARAYYGGRPGHPVAIPCSLFAALGELDGDEGARGLLGGAGVRLVDCDGLGSGADVDTVADLEALAQLA